MPHLVVRIAFLRKWRDIHQQVGIRIALFFMMNDLSYYAEGVGIAQTRHSTSWTL